MGAGLRDIIVGGFSELFRSEAETSFGALADAFWSIMFLVGIAFIVFIFWRVLRVFTAYAGAGEELGSLKLHIMGLSTIKGNLNKNDTAINDGTLETVSHVSELKEGIEELKKLYDNKQLYIYDYRVTDYDDVFDWKGGKDSIIISPVDIMDLLYAWQDTKGDRSIVSPSFRMKSKNIFCFQTTEFHEDLVDPYGDLFDAYILTPIPREILMKMSTSDHAAQAVLQLTKLEMGKSITKIASYMETIAENWMKIEPNKKEIERLRDELQKKDNELSDVYRKIENERHIGVPHPLIGHKWRQRIESRSSMAVWIVVSVFAGAFGYSLDENIPAIGNTISGWVGAGAVMFLLIMVYMYYDSKRQDRSEKESTEEPKTL